MRSSDLAPSCPDLSSSLSLIMPEYFVMRDSDVLKLLAIVVVRRFTQKSMRA